MEGGITLPDEVNHRGCAELMELLADSLAALVTLSWMPNRFEAQHGADGRSHRHSYVKPCSVRRC
jgi:hypothetical protein